MNILLKLLNHPEIKVAEASAKLLHSITIDKIIISYFFAEEKLISSNIVLTLEKFSKKPEITKSGIIDSLIGCLCNISFSSSLYIIILCRFGIYSPIEVLQYYPNQSISTQSLTILELIRNLQED
eukprot:c11807_g1_i2.p1 GENE.c11807_g1_i2~~c11807_g1_i2.p1  ORF type:complete len:125 (+),score=14.33 c11807_g1_i2:98-472(+)